MGIGGKKPLRVYSSVKYGSVARGDAAIFMKFPKAGYQEKVLPNSSRISKVPPRQSNFPFGISPFRFPEKGETLYRNVLSISFFGRSAGLR